MSITQALPSPPTGECHVALLQLPRGIAATRLQPAPLAAATGALPPVDGHARANPASRSELTPILALHAAQHIVLTQKMLQRHRKKGLTPQDQGFTRPTVLVLLPFRAHALAFVNALLALLPPCYEQVKLPAPS